MCKRVIKDWNNGACLGKNVIYSGQCTVSIKAIEIIHITTFVSGGPKNYNYQLNAGKTICKFRGITLNHTTQQDVNCEVMSKMVRVEVRDPHAEIDLIQM